MAKWLFHPELNRIMLENGPQTNDPKTIGPKTQTPNGQRWEGHPPTDPQPRSPTRIQKLIPKSYLALSARLHPSLRVGLRGIVTEFKRTDTKPQGTFHFEATQTLTGPKNPVVRTLYQIRLISIRFGRGNPPVVAPVLGRRGSAQGHDPYPFILFQAQRIWY